LDGPRATNGRQTPPGPEGSNGRRSVRVPRSACPAERGFLTNYSWHTK